MPTLSKSKIIAFRQCPKRLWLEVHRPDLREDSPASQARFQVGHQVGEISRKLYDLKGTGAFIDRDKDGFKAAFEQSAKLIEEANRPIFEAGFRLCGTIAFADVAAVMEDGRGQILRQRERLPLGRCCRSIFLGTRDGS